MKLVGRGELSIPRVARDLGISDSLLRLWVEKAKTAENGGLTADERIELARLRKENRILKEEREIQKSGDLLREGEPIVNRYRFIEAEKVNPYVSMKVETVPSRN